MPLFLARSFLPRDRNEKIGKEIKKKKKIHRSEIGFELHLTTTNSDRERKKKKRKRIPGNRDPGSCNICRGFRHLACKFNDRAPRRNWVSLFNGALETFLRVQQHSVCSSTSAHHGRFNEHPRTNYGKESDSLARLRKNPDTRRTLVSSAEHRNAYEKPESLWLNECVTPSLPRSLLSSSGFIHLRLKSPLLLLLLLSLLLLHLLSVSVCV